MKKRKKNSYILKGRAGSFHRSCPFYGDKPGMSTGGVGDAFAADVGAGLQAVELGVAGAEGEVSAVEGQWLGDAGASMLCLKVAPHFHSYAAQSWES